MPPYHIHHDLKITYNSSISWMFLTIILLMLSLILMKLYLIIMNYKYYVGYNNQPIHITIFRNIRNRIRNIRRVNF